MRAARSSPASKIVILILTTSSRSGAKLWSSSIDLSLYLSKNYRGVSASGFKSRASSGKIKRTSSGNKNSISSALYSKNFGRKI